MIELISASYEDFSSDVFIRFGGSSENTCFLLDGVDVEGGVEFINKGFRDFFAGEVDYPMVIGDLEFDWLAFESAHVRCTGRHPDQRRLGRTTRG